MFPKRLNAAAQKLEQERTDAYLVSKVTNIEYLTGLSCFSKEEREAYILLTEESAYLFTDARYTHEIKGKLKNVKLCEVSSQKKLTDYLKEISERENLVEIGVDSTFTYAEFSRIHSALTKQKKYINKISLKSDFIEELRIHKDSEEIKNIIAACALTDKTFNNIVRHIKSGVSEKEIEWKIEKCIRESGGQLTFRPIVAFGSNSAIPHHENTDKKLSKSDSFILLDFGARINGYNADMTRTIFSHAPSNKAAKMYETVKNSQQAGIDYLKSSRDASSVDKVCRDYITQNDFPTIPHSVGHGVGLEVHESPTLSPNSDQKLEENMIFTIEPGVYEPGFGGIRIEDTILLTEKGPEVLFKTPKKLIVL